MNDKENRKRPSMLLTGASGMLGRYVAGAFSDFCIVSLGRGEGNDIRCDLSRETPDFSGRSFDLVVHCAGTRDEAMARDVNAGGTRRLLDALAQNPPEAFVLISSTDVYGKETGEDVDESSPVWPSTQFGSSRLDAERMAENEFGNTGTVLTILRPVAMFGSGLSGWAQEMFSDVLSGRYLHIRGNDAKMSLVTAYDVARAVRAVYAKGGVYNVSDGHPHTWLELAEAMSANAGRQHRMMTLPEKWASFLSRPVSLFPGLRRMFDAGAMRRRSQTLTFSPERIKDDTGICFHDTVEVIARRDSGYPYEEK